MTELKTFLFDRKFQACIYNIYIVIDRTLIVISLVRILAENNLYTNSSFYTHNQLNIFIYVPSAIFKKLVWTPVKKNKDKGGHVSSVCDDSNAIAPSLRQP